MALWAAAARPSTAQGWTAGVARLRGRLAGAGRALWGLVAGLLFLLAFPLAVVLAPLLWAFERLRDMRGEGRR
jgi:hypothetical protein